MLPRGRLLTCLLAAALGAAGCGDRTPSDEEQVRTVLNTFARAVEGRDYETLCTKVFSPRLLEGVTQIGLPCEVAMRNSLGEVESPRLTVGGIDVAGSKATAEVRSSAENQEPSSDTVRLEKVGGSWKVSALGEESAEPRPTPTP